MKVAVLSESGADEAATRILVGAILGREIQPVEYFSLRTRGWPSVVNMIRPVLSHLHYQTDAYALAVVVDGNHSLIHDASHEGQDSAETKCRYCALRQSVESTVRRLKPVTGREPIRVAVGVAIPAIEAWYLCAGRAELGEAAWRRGIESGMDACNKIQLKRLAYDTERPSLELETRKAAEHCARLSDRLQVVEDKFPSGFGNFAREVRSWNQ